MLKAVLFDLDGTLLPMDQNVFTKGYFKLLSKKISFKGYDTQTFINTIWAGTHAMVLNDGKRTNGDVFLDKYCEILGEGARNDEEIFLDFYANEFEQARDCCGYNPDAAKTVKEIKELGLRVALATNPIFPKVATERRIKWTGLEPEDFEFCTSYENIGYCKPNPEYYREVLHRVGVAADECLMVGNDVNEDMVAEQIGMKVFLLTDCMINKENKDITCYPRGSFQQLLEYIKTNI